MHSRIIPPAGGRRTSKHTQKKQPCDVKLLWCIRANRTGTLALREGGGGAEGEVDFSEIEAGLIMSFLHSITPVCTSAGSNGSEIKRQPESSVS